MAASVNFRNLLLALILGFLILATHVKSYPNPRTTDVEERDDNRTAPPVPETGSLKALAKRVDLVGTWNSLRDPQKALIRQIKAWDLQAGQPANYGASYCYGCVIVVIASRGRLVIAHLAEVTVDKYNFQDDTAFLVNIEEPLEGALDENKQRLGNTPSVLVFGPTPVQGGDLSYRGKINQLVGVVRGVFPQASVALYAYVKKTAFSESNQNVEGKVTVIWSGSGLSVYAETTLQIQL
ncbi:hypothetical protein GP486_006134 [Trichoglossum hirsutum]|uniref:Uncharacterized protein n=1 Tax=Trichoglossum hirsutum TaxID=265104 RepID=A0A9P8L7X2_9PEZI|nr:hypothetical protein GP486_006134 [Trichoglossum hirsutum]